MPNDPLEEARALLAQGNILGEQASQLTGIAFTPTTFTAPPPTTPLTQPTVLSSQAGADLFRQAQTDVSDLEKKVSGGITIPQGATLSGLAQQHGTTVQELMRLNPQITDPNRIMAGATLNVPQIIRPLGEPATDAMIRDINRVASGGQLTAAQARALTGVQNIQDDLTAAAAAARAALERRDFNALEQARERAQANIQRLRETTEQLFKDLAPLRQRRLDLMAPSERERELRGQLNEIRQKAEEFRLQTEQEKFSEFERQTMGFAAGRAREIDIRASFKLQEMALKERNILMELGMEQEARQLESKTVEQQLDMLREDFDLRNAVEREIERKEMEILDRFERLSKQQKKDAMLFINTLAGKIDPDKLTPEMRQQLDTLIAQTGLPADLMMNTLKVEFQRETHKQAIAESERALKMRLLSAQTARAGKDLTTPPPSPFGETQFQLTPEEFSTLQGMGLDQIQIANIGGIVSGLRPPLSATEMRTVGGQKTAAGLAAIGYDATKALQDWTAMQERLSSMNSTQQLRLSQAIFALSGSVEQAKRLYDQWQATGVPTGFSTFNSLALKAAARSPGQAGVAARTLISHIEDMAAELAVIYRGGNTPTDMALQAAQRSLGAEWNAQQFAQNLQLIEQNLRIRQNSILNSAQVPGNIYSPEVRPLEDFFQSGTFSEEKSQIFDDVINKPQGYWSNLWGAITGRR